MRGHKPRLLLVPPRQLATSLISLISLISLMSR